MKMTQYRLRCLLGAVLLGLFSLSLSASPQENEIILPELPSGLFASHDEISWAESVLEDFRDEVGTETSFIADDDQAELPYDQAMEAWSAMNSVLRDLQSSVDQCVNPEACNWPMNEVAFDAMMASLRGASQGIQSSIAIGTVNAYCTRTNIFLLKQLLDLLGKNKTTCPVLSTLQESYLSEADGHLDFATTILTNSQNLARSSTNYPSNLTQAMGYIKAAMDNISYAFFDGYEPEWVVSVQLQDNASVVDDPDAWKDASASLEEGLDSLEHLVFFKNFDHFKNPIKDQIAQAYTTLGLLCLEAAESTAEAWADSLHTVSYSENPISEEDRNVFLDMLQQGAGYLSAAKKYAREDSEQYYLSEGVLYAQSGADMLLDAAEYMVHGNLFYAALVTAKERTKHSIQEVKKAF